MAYNPSFSIESVDLSIIYEICGTGCGIGLTWALFGDYLLSKESDLGRLD